MMAARIGKLAASLLRIKRLWLAKADSLKARSRDSVLGAADREAAMRRLMEYRERKPRYDGAGQPS
jgi:hypothetical protein